MSDLKTHIINSFKNEESKLLSRAMSYKHKDRVRYFVQTFYVSFERPCSVTFDYNENKFVSITMLGYKEEILL